MRRNRMLMAAAMTLCLPAALAAQQDSNACNEGSTVVFRNAYATVGNGNSAVFAVNQFGVNQEDTVMIARQDYTPENTNMRAAILTLNPDGEDMLTIPNVALRCADGASVNRTLVLLMNGIRISGKNNRDGTHGVNVAVSRVEGAKTRRKARELVLDGAPPG